MYSRGPPHMDVQKQDDQLELTYSNYVRTQDVTLKTCRRRWVIGRSGERGSGISVLTARHDDDDDIYIFCPTSVRRNRWGWLAGTLSPVLVWNMQSSMEGDNSLIRYESALNFEWRKVDGPIKPQDACCCEKGVEGRTNCPLIFLNLGEKAKEEDLDWRRETFANKARTSTTNKEKGILCSHPKAGVAFHLGLKKKKRKFRKRKTKNKTINYQSSQKRIPWAEAPFQNRHFSSILTLARAHRKKPFCSNRKNLQGMSQNFSTNGTGREMFS